MYNRALSLSFLVQILSRAAKKITIIIVIMVWCGYDMVGSFGISWWIPSLVKGTLHCRRAGFEPQRKSPLRKRVKAHHAFREAA